MSTTLPVKYDPAMFDRLTAKEQAFIQHPLVMTKPIEAAVASGYSESWARGNAHSKRKQLMYFILPEVHKRMAKSGITLDRIQEELAAVAFADATEAFDRVDTDDGDKLVAKDPTLLPEGLRRAIEQVEVHNHTLTTPSGPVITQTYSIVLHDKKPALKMLAEMLGGFDPRTREPGDAAERRRQSALFDWMKPDEIDTIVKIYQRAEKRQLAAATDAEVIETKK